MQLRIPLAVGVPAALVILTASACSSSPASSANSTPAIAAPSMSPVGGAPAVKPATKSCKPTFDYLVRTTEPGVAAQAQEIGNLNLATCQDALSDFQATAGQASGECTTIAKASSNPGYDVNAQPAPPLKHVLMSAGPGC